MQVGDLVKIQTKHEGDKLAVVVEPHFSTVGREWIVKRTDTYRMTIAAPCDLEVVSEAR